MGFDSDRERVSQLSCGLDIRECEKKGNIEDALKNSIITSDLEDLKDCNIYVACVPTGVTQSHKPDLNPLKDVCTTIGNTLKKGDIVIFESTVFPGVTEEICVPILEECSHLIYNKDFSVGYSPERINVGDNTHQIASTSKIISASNAEALDLIELIYSSVISAPLSRASNIKVAEAAKMYENVQRDALIALANEMSDYCRAEGINIKEVTECASTKWNFSSVMPGLVGGHCIGVDSYYLLARASDLNMELPLVSLSRQVNEAKVQTIANRIKTYVDSMNKPLSEISILILGVSYKPNTPDTRNSKAIELIHLLRHDVATIDCCDPLVDSVSLSRKHAISVIPSLSACQWDKYDIVLEMVPHKCFNRCHEKCSLYLRLSDII